MNPDWNKALAPAPLTCVSCIFLTGTGYTLLTERKKQPGYWSPAGGVVERGESLIQATLREVYEELGLTLDPYEVTRVHSGEWPAEDNNPMPGQTTVFLYAADASPLRQLVRPGPGEAQARWFPMEAMWDEKINPFVHFYRGIRDSLLMDAFKRRWRG